MKIDLDNLAQLQRLKKFDIGDEAYTLAFSPNGDLLAVGSNHLVQVWQIHDGRLLYSIDGPTLPATVLPVAPAIQKKQVLRVRFSSDMKYLVSLFGNQILLSQASDGQAQRFLQPDGYDVAFSPDNTAIAIATANKIYLQSLSTGDLIQSFPMPSETGNIWCLTFSPDGTIMAAGTATQQLHYRGTFDNPQGWEGQKNAVLRLWRTRDGRIASTQTHKSSIVAIAFSQKDNRLAITTQDGKVWMYPPKEIFFSTSWHFGEEAVETTFSPDGMLIAVATRDDTILLMKTANNPKLSRKLEGHFGTVNLSYSHLTGHFLLQARKTRLCICGESGKERIGTSGNISPPIPPPAMCEIYQVNK